MTALGRCWCPLVELSVRAARSTTNAFTPEVSPDCGFSLHIELEKVGGLSTKESVA